jgi:hypothetical protein
MSEQRRLAAILVADVVGYLKLAGTEETGTGAGQLQKQVGRKLMSPGRRIAGADLYYCALPPASKTPAQPMRCDEHGAVTLAAIVGTDKVANRWLRHVRFGSDATF